MFVEFIGFMYVYRAWVCRRGVCACVFVLRA